MKAKYCLPIIKKSKSEVLQSLKLKGYDFYEIWLDYIKDLELEFISKIAKKNPGQLIFLFRRDNGEEIKLPLKDRLEIVSLLSKFNVILDLDFLTQYDELKAYNNIPPGNNQLILSYHNYKETPRPDYLTNMVNKVRRYNPDILKFACLCENNEDALILLNLLLRLKEQKLKYIVLGMGEAGLITRIAAILWGNEINYAPRNLREKSAAGQLTKKQLQLILEGIGNGR